VPVDVSEDPNAGVRIQPWTPGPQDAQLRPGAVDVWRVDLAAVADDLLELLSAGERARAERMTSARARARWARSHAVLRVLLGRYLQNDPRDLGLTTDDRGKPTLEMPSPGTGGEADPTPLFFNLSHSGGTALYALTAIGPVGVDVEVARRAIDTVGLAARAFGPDEAARLRKLEPEAREREFLQAWVRHEATHKCLGSGIGRSAELTTGSSPWLSVLQIGERAAAAVAVSGLPTEVRCWDWSGAARSPGESADR
jgi:4'-phosphopantetheinyl transferase